ncbi:hypothetical protein [Halobacillus litoralis]|uniref:Phage head-tail adapter protein n=1 Tax=Halobacillus litoralis TaxID=45668 RepID=A0A410MDJ1_9BACI|nr:hypothetical protein [Halobacillus litoralis]QAS52809.1 hypothetical protein HLI_11685 [Halobacillus litoralis]
MGQQIFYFDEVFASFQVPFEAIKKSEGYRDHSNGGQWVPGADLPPETLEGIIVPLSNDDMRFDTQGRYTEKDRKLYLQHPQRLKKNDHIYFEGQDYRVFDVKNHGVYADFSVYIIKGIDKGGGGSP